MENLDLFIPEATILLGAVLLFIVSVVGGKQRISWIVSVVMAGAGVATSIWKLNEPGDPFTFEKIYHVDAFTQVLKIGITLALLLTLLVAQRAESFRERTRVEMPIFLFFSALGMMMLVSAVEMLTLYVALELSAYGLYIIAVLSRKQREGSEAGAKYILFGAASSAVTLYGISLIYGAAQSTHLADIAQHQGSALMFVGILLALGGVLFKLAVFPFHAWAPDVYQAAPHEAATFIGTASKVAAIGIIARLMYLVMPGDPALTTTLLILCVASMTVGNLAAIIQNDLKRLLAYSTVAHAGYILIGLVSYSQTGLASAIFYGLTYVPIVFCVFLVVCVLGADGSNPTRASLAGLYKRSPLLGVTLLVGIFGLAGIPPTAGFAGKWFLFSAAMKSDMLWLVLVGAINATVSLYYYLTIVRDAYLVPPEDERAVAVPPVTAITAWVAMGLVLVTGFYPRVVWELAESAARTIAP